MSVIAKRIDIIVSADLAPMLKQAGFRKQARNFRREHDNHTDVINVQADRYNDANHGRFTVNLGVYYPAIADISEALPVNGPPKEYNCTARERIGFLMEARADFWWEIDRRSNDADTAHHLANTVATCGMPWLDDLSDLDAVKRFAASNHGLFIAAGIALHQGDREGAQDYFDREMATANEHVKPSLATWANKHGLNVSHLSDPGR